MKIFILEWVSDLTDRWHSGGGLVVIAENIEHAKELVKEDSNIKPNDKEWGNAIIFDLKKKEKARYWVFQDAGCC